MRTEQTFRRRLPLWAALGASCALASVALAFDADEFSAAGLAEAPAPTGVRVGKDNGEQKGGTHYAGEDCGICHTPGGKAGDHVFTISGTLYQDRLGSLPLAGAEVLLQDVDGHVLSMTTNAAGNFWTKAPLASNPRSIASHGGVTEPLYHRADDGAFVAADPADSRTWQYKAWIKNGDQAISMITVAPVGGANGDTPRMSCGMHHSPTGSTGAAWVSRIPALRDYPTEAISFSRHVRPILASKCAPCHVPGERKTRLVTQSDVAETDPTSIDYSAGNDFSAYDSYEVRVGSGDDAHLIEKGGVFSAIDLEQPEQSDLLQKPLIRKPGSEVEHPAGGFWTASDPDYRLILRWIREGAQNQ